MKNIFKKETTIQKVKNFAKDNKVVTVALALVAFGIAVKEIYTVKKLQEKEEEEVKIVKDFLTEAKKQ